MIKSMTAYGRAFLEGEDKDITVEIRSVNSRYFDCSVRLPRSYLYMEEKIKSYLQKNVISRGKVEVFVTVDTHHSGVLQVEADLSYAKGYVDALRLLCKELDLKDDISVMTVARNPEIFTVRREAEDTEGEWERVLGVLTEAGKDFSAMREREGARTEEDIRAKLVNVAAWRDEVGELSKKDIGSYRQKLEARLRAVLDDNVVTVDENRILTECAIFADRIAIDEELVRLASHFRTFDEIVRAGEPSGKKLDFLMQEMNRETNTIGSKCQNAEIASLVVKMKNELEKIREQIQNVE